MRGYTRRDVLKLGGVAAGAGLGFPAVLRAQQKEVVGGARSASDR